MAERNENKGNTPNQGNPTGNQGQGTQNDRGRAEQSGPIGKKHGEEQGQQRSGDNAGGSRAENDRDERNPQAGNRPGGDASRTQAGNQQDDKRGEANTGRTGNQDR